MPCDTAMPSEPNKVNMNPFGCQDSEGARGVLQRNEGALEMQPRKQSGRDVDMPPRGNPNEVPC